MATYVGNGKKHPKFDGCISMGFTKEHLEVLKTNLNDKGWVNVIISPKRDDPEKYYAKIDDYKKEPF
jgi:hypothetical protein